MEIKRIVAKKASVAEIVSGKFMRGGEKESSYVLTNQGRKISRARILSMVIDKFVSEDERYATITLDDGTETIRCKAFVNVKVFDGITKGDLVDVFGKLREYEGEIYLTPEIVRRCNANQETLRLLELEKIVREQKEKIAKIEELRKKCADLNELKTLAKTMMSEADAEAIIEMQQHMDVAYEENATKNIAAKEHVLNLIKTLDDGSGVDYEKLVAESKLEETIIDNTVQQLLESGTCFEPKPGKIKLVIK